jgi:gamma-glutamyltranspeptidase/glutathione hydrolase
MAFYDGVVGGRSVGVPGTVRMLEMAHRQYGKLPWAQLFAPAIQLAEQGFRVSPRLNTLLKDEKYLAKNDPVAAAYFYKPDGTPVDAGSVLRNPALADVLRQHRGGRLQSAARRQGGRSHRRQGARPCRQPGQARDERPGGYQPKKRDPICSDYNAGGEGLPPVRHAAAQFGRDRRRADPRHPEQHATLGLVTGSGGVPGTVSPTPSADWLHLYTEASRLAFADRGQYLGDPDFVQPPGGSWMSLLEPAYLSERARLIQATGPSMKIAQPGVPGAVKTAYAPMPEQVEHGTSHISIVDGYGDAIAMTTTIEDQFGSRLMTDGGTGAGGFLLNNELTDFSFAPADAEGKPVANRVQPGKRPRSSMAPTLVFDKTSGQLVMSGGSPGGALIIHFTAKTLYGALNWGLNAQQAIDLPNFASLNGPSILEEKRFSPATVRRCATAAPRCASRP